MIKVNPYNTPLQHEATPPPARWQHPLHPSPRPGQKYLHTQYHPSLAYSDCTPLETHALATVSDIGATFRPLFVRSLSPLELLISGFLGYERGERTAGTGGRFDVVMGVGFFEGI
jgi:hypothetical protein